MYNIEGIQVFIPHQSFHLSVNCLRRPFSFHFLFSSPEIESYLSMPYTCLNNNDVVCTSLERYALVKNLITDKLDSSSKKSDWDMKHGTCVLLSISTKRSNCMHVYSTKLTFCTTKIPTYLLFFADLNSHFQGR